MKNGLSFIYLFAIHLKTSECIIIIFSVCHILSCKDAILLFLILNNDNQNLHTLEPSDIKYSLQQMYKIDSCYFITKPLLTPKKIDQKNCIHCNAVKEEYR
jgi:hypothetical protein